MEFVDEFSEMADIVSRINGKPQAKDWLAIAMKSGHVGQRMYDRVQTALHAHQQSKLDGWYANFAMQAAFLSLRVDGRLVETDAEASLAVPFKLDDTYDILWTAMFERPTFQYRTSDHPAIKQLVQDYIWAKGPLVHQVLCPTGQTQIPSGISRECETRLAQRVQAYLEQDVSRVFMLTGLPGTGKTESCQRVVERLGVRTYAAPASELGTTSFIEATRVGAEALLIDDLDWTTPEDMSQLLAELSKLRDTVKLIFVTVNRVDNLPAPMLRPGRIDEVVTWPGCTLDEVQRLGAPERCVGWPIASVHEAVTRLRVEGTADFDEIERRIGQEPATSPRRNVLKRVDSDANVLEDP